MTNPNPLTPPRPAGIRCPAKGGCGGRHRTVAEVRACQGVKPKAVPPIAARVPDPISGPQRDLIGALLTERDLSSLNGPVIETWSNLASNWDVHCPRPAASKIIDFLKSLPKLEAGADGQPGLNRSAPNPHFGSAREQMAAARGQFPDGRYAIPIGGSWKFYQVDGLRLVLRDKSGQHVVHDFATKLAVFAKINANPKGAAISYGKKVGRCAICHRQLTDDKNKGPDGLTSIQRGIGPVCITRL